MRSALWIILFVALALLLTLFPNGILTERDNRGDAVHNVSGADNLVYKGVYSQARADTPVRLPRTAASFSARASHQTIAEPGHWPDV